MVIVGSADYVEREWDTLATLPKISVLHGSPMSRADLRVGREYYHTTLQGHLAGSECEPV